MMKKSVLFTDVYHHLWKLPGGDTETGKGKRIRINFYTHNTSLFSFRSHVNKLQKSRTGCLRVEPRISAMENPDILQQNWSYTGKDSCLQLSWLPELWACCPCLGQPRTPRLLVFVIGYEGYLESLGKRGSMRYFLDQIILWACLVGGYLKLIDFGRPSPAHVTPFSWLGMRDGPELCKGGEIEQENSTNAFYSCSWL